MSEETKEIEAVQQTTALAPMSPEDAKAMMMMYQEYQKALLDESDYQAIQGKEFKKKSAWRKLAMANNLSVRVVDERREELPNGDYAYHFVAEATHPNGRVTSGSGSCTAYEKAKLIDGKWKTTKGNEAEANSLHNVRTTAETRSWNRAVSNMIAAGEVSAEEVDQGHGSPQTKPANTWPKENAVVDKPVETVDSTPQEGQLLCTWAHGDIRVDTSKPTCPQCKMAMYDNRDKKASGEYSQTYGDFTCKDQKCTIESNGKNYRTGVWISKEQPSQEEDIIIEDEPPF